MDGYSVSEAASVLGVPIERVWELLARGVLAGAPEGETGMRVFLHPRPASPPAAAVSPQPPENGGTREPERELSPFRELLTEFRNLTERYGQALLALGESRGEVASLRSRVDLLEARMDLGLPAPGRVRASGSWGASTYGQEQTVMPTAPPDEEAERPHETEEHRTRRRGPRRATESFAEALARAEDPSPPELRAAEVGDAARHEGPEEPALPRELPAADTVPVAEEPGAEDVASDASDVAEPTLPATPEPAVAIEPDAEVAPEAAVEPEAEEAVEAAVEPEVEVPPEPGGSLEPAAAEAGPDEVRDSDEPEATPQSAEATTDHSSAVVEGADLGAEPVTWDTDRYTAAIEEPDWYEAEAEADERAAASEAEPEPTATTEAPDAEDATSVAPEETLLWLQGDRASAPTLPGSGELESALEALGATGPATSEVADAVPEQVPEPAAPEAAEQASPPRTVPPSALRYRPVAPTGPTGRAYRRLRRIFPD